MLPFVADLPPQIQERVVCSITAAVKYEIPANIMLAIAEKEAGTPGQWVCNSNGTHDVGPMQFNTNYLRELSRYGIQADDVAAAGCYSYDLAAWRVRQHIRNDKGDIWTRAANYHSRTPRHNAKYRADLIQKALKWATWLKERFIVKEDVAAPAITTSTQTITQEAEDSRIGVSATSTVQQKRKARGTPNDMGYVPRSISFRIKD